ncbi:MAG: hypothetical protein QOI83_2258 [Streptomycetaceae bacterium]|jgi:hypothetical protein|nr:hypothetical protein [Streptomycetaceae bacterium]
MVLLRLPYLALTSVFAFIRLLPMTDTDKDIEILTRRHQLPVLQLHLIVSPGAPWSGTPRGACCHPAGPCGSGCARRRSMPSALYERRKPPNGTRRGVGGAVCEP